MVEYFSTAFTIFLIVSDGIIFVAALSLSTLLRESITFGRVAYDYQLPWPVYVVGLVVWLFIYIILEIYSPKHALRLVTELLYLTGTIILAWFILIGGLYLSFRDVSRLQMLYVLILMIGMTWAHRAAVRGYFRLRGGRTFDSRRAIIIGDSPDALRLGQAIGQNAWAGLYLEGYLAEDNSRPRWLAAPDEVFRIIRQHNITEILIAPTPEQEAPLMEMVYQLQLLPVNIRVVPQYTKLLLLNSNVETLNGVPLITLKQPTLNTWQRLLKRTFDIIVSLLLLPFLLPTIGLIALLIRLQDGGPAFFLQERIGEGKQPFIMYKFRTMHVNAERDKVIKRDQSGNVIHKQPDDPRVTPLGRHLRRWSLDELPQIFNVLRSDMSLVGPRPELPWLVDLYDDWQHVRFEVPQGVTGWWQVTRGEESLMHMHTDADLYYIRNYSILLDLRILFMTINAVFTGRGAY